MEDIEAVEEKEDSCMGGSSESTTEIANIGDETITENVTSVKNSNSAVLEDQPEQQKIPEEGAGALVGSTPVVSPENNSEINSIYLVKWITWRNEAVPIVTQNENGPCPLLAIFNVLLLSKKVTLRSETEMISIEQIIAHVADVIWKNMPKELPENEQSNYEQNVSDAMSVFPNLQTGLDVNVKFSSVSSFEYTPELTVFDLLRIPLYHGWLVDPQDCQVQNVIGNLSYNQIVEKIINLSSNKDPAISGEGLIAQQFLEATASQITCHGIVSLCEKLQPDDLAVLFRNNHFSTLCRHKDELFTLITDLGFLRESNVIWETLSSIHGDSNFVDSNFLNSPPKSNSAGSPSGTTDLDYQIALSLQQNQSEDTGQTSLSDYELAKQLQQIEMDSGNQLSPSGRSSRPQTAHSQVSRPDNRQDVRRPLSAPSNQSNSDKCSIL